MAAVSGSPQVIGKASAQDDTGEKAEEAECFKVMQASRFEEALQICSKQDLATGRDLEMHTALHWGALGGSNTFIRAALEAKADVDAVSVTQQTPLMWATVRGHTQAIRILLDARANARAKDSLGVTPLTLALQHKQHAALLLFMSRGPRAEMFSDTDENGCTAVHWAAFNGDLHGAKLLEYFDADFSVVDGEGRTALHRAVQGSQSGVVEMLLEKKINPHQRDGSKQSGDTALDIAVKQGDSRMYQVLSNFGIHQVSDAGGTGAFDGEAGSVFDLDVEQGAKPQQQVKSEAERKAKAEMAFLHGKAIQNVPPAVWLVCTSLCLYQFLTDLQHTSATAAPQASLAFGIGVPLSVALFLYVAMCDPGKVPSRLRGHSAVEELMRMLDQENGSCPDVGRLCTSTWVLKAPRAKFCDHTKACIEEFDHWCMFLNCAIGKGNHRAFLLLTVCEVGTQLVHCWLCVCVLLELVPFESIFTWPGQVLTGFPLTVWMLLVHALTVPALLIMLLDQFRLIAMNLTTNETMNAHRYEHFWAYRPSGLRVFRNPFHKGSVSRNCLEFWAGSSRVGHGPELDDKQTWYINGIVVCEQGPCVALAGTCPYPLQHVRDQWSRGRELLSNTY